MFPNASTLDPGLQLDSILVVLQDEAENSGSYVVTASRSVSHNVLKEAQHNKSFLARLSQFEDSRLGSIWLCTANTLQAGWSHS